MPRAMSLLFLRSTCADLLAFEHEALTTEDRLAAALLFRGPSRLADVAAFAARRASGFRRRLPSHGCAEPPARGDRLRVGPGPRCVRSRWPSCSRASGTLRQRKAAVSLARAQKWTDCLQTRVKLGSGDYVLRVGRGGTEIVFPGEARAVETDVDRPRFSTRLAAASIDPEHEAAVLEMLADRVGATPGVRRRKVRRRGGTRRVAE